MSGDIITTEELNNITKDLLAFIHRVSLNEKATPAELAVRPEVAKTIYKVMGYIN